MSLDLVLAASLRRSGAARDRAADVVTTTLDAMASGGIYDHLGGGFARYSTDEQWLVPHFEKMLYDQALLVRVYTHAAQALGLPRYRQVVEETVGYVLGELRHPAGGFFSVRGRRLARRARPRPRGPVLRVDPGAVHGRARRRSARGDRVVRARRTGQLRGPVDPLPAAPPWRPGSPTGDRVRQAAPVRRPCRTRRDPGSTTRCSPSGTPSCCRRCARPPRRSAATTGAAAATSNGEFLLDELRGGRRPLAPFVAGGREPAGAPRGAGRRPRRARRRVHPPRRAHRRRPLDRCRE